VQFTEAKPLLELLRWDSAAFTNVQSQNDIQRKQARNKMCWT